MNSIFNNHIKQQDVKFGNSFLYSFYCVIFYLLVFALFILNILPTAYPSFHELQPSFLIATIFYTSLFMPWALPLFTIFLIGIAFDLVVGFPLGISSLLFVLTSLLVKSQRRFLLGQSFAVLWLGFSVLTSIFFISKWLVISLFNWHLFNFTPIIINTILTILIFPFIVVLFHKLKRLIAKEKQV